MVNLNKMYDGVVNSPETYLTQNLAADATIIYVADSSVFGSIPNLAVIGTDQNAETILIKSKRSDGGLEVQRALEGSAKRWEKTTAIARNFTNFDYQQIRDNIEKLNKGKQESLTAGNNIQITNGRISATDTKYDDTKIKEDISELKNSQLAKASQTEAESGVNNTKYMTPQATKQAIEKLSPVKNSLSEMDEDSTHRTVTDTEKAKWNKKFDLPVGKENQVLTKTTDGAEFKNISSSRSATFVIANYDSSENSKNGADYVIKKSDSVCTVINSFIKKLPNCGGKIQLTEGVFLDNIGYTILIDKDDVAIEGYGNSTKLIIKTSQKDIPFFDIKGNQTTISDLSVNVTDTNCIKIAETVEGCILKNLRAKHTSKTYCCISIQGSNNFITNCSCVVSGSAFEITGGDNTITSCKAVLKADDYFTAFAIKSDNNLISQCSANVKKGIILTFTNKANNNNCNNCTGITDDGNAIISNGAYNQITNCFVKASKWATIIIQGSNNKFVNCNSEQLSDSVNAFMIQGNYNQIINCQGIAKIGDAYQVSGNNNQLTNCVGTSDKYAVFYLEGKNHQTINCKAIPISTNTALYAKGENHIIIGNDCSTGIIETSNLTNSIVTNNLQKN